jgi:uncharacterized membrane protein
MKAAEIVLIAAVLLTGTMAGIFFTYSNSVMAGLAKLSDVEFVNAMRSINREIQNPLFFVCFFGPLILLPLSAGLSYHSSRTVFVLLSAAAVIYASGAFGVTVTGNVPLNEQLESTGSIDAKAARAHFENSWNVLNRIRAFASVIAALLAIVACAMR